MLFCLVWLGLVWTFEVDRDIPTEYHTYVIEETVSDNIYTVTKRPDWVVPENVPEYVTVTVYQPTVFQCDSDPDVLADGTKIDVYQAGEYRYCALSRDLLKRWGGNIAYGDTLLIEGVGHFSGKWVVKDTMNSRWTNRVDLLTSIGTRNYKFEDAKFRKVM